MELYIGGCFQGKTAYVKNKYPDIKLLDENTFEELFDLKGSEVRVWNHFHLAVLKLFQRGMDAEEIKGKILSILDRNENLVIISDEIGNGIVPMEKLQRTYREETGRLLIEIAKRSDHVERIICGMAQVIK